jgi:hypothetical protein
MIPANSETIPRRWRPKRALFEGVDGKGLPHGLLFPASPAVSLNGEFLFVTNLALDLRVFRLPQGVDSQWRAQVRHFTVSRIRTHFRPLG